MRSEPDLPLKVPRNLPGALIPFQLQTPRGQQRKKKRQTPDRSRSHCRRSHCRGSVPAGSVGFSLCFVDPAIASAAFLFLSSEPSGSTWPPAVPSVVRASLPAAASGSPRCHAGSAGQPRRDSPFSAQKDIGGVAWSRSGSSGADWLRAPDDRRAGEGGAADWPKLTQRGKETFQSGRSEGDFFFCSMTAQKSGLGANRGRRGRGWRPMKRQEGRGQSAQWGFPPKWASLSSRLFPSGRDEGFYLSFGA